MLSCLYLFCVLLLALRLACLYALCRALTDLTGEYQEAKAIALATYDFGTKHVHTLTDVAVDILQRLKDEFLIKEAPPLGDEDDEDDDDSVLGEANGTDASAVGSIVVGADGEKYTSNLKKSHSSRRASLKKSNKRLNAALMESIEQQYTANVELARPSAIEDVNNLENIAATAPVPSTMSKELQDLVIAIKRAMFVPSPIPLDSFSSGLEIFKALDTIFKVYIRGNALAGLQSTGSEVAISNRQLALSKFLLEGPFISWRGFSSVLVDFKALSRHDPILSSANAGFLTLALLVNI